MSGLKKIQSIAEVIAQEYKEEHPLGESLQSIIVRNLKSHIVEINQQCSFSVNHIPTEEKEQSEFRKYAKGAALQKLAVEGLSEVVITENRIEGTPMGPEEVITYKVFALKP